MRTISIDEFLTLEAQAWGGPDWPGGIDPRNSTPASTSPALVLVSRGNWIAECPGRCGYASVMHRGFSWLRCPNHRQGFPVEWPDDWPQIEAALGKRPEANQNMAPEETLADLLKENVAHGLD